MTEPALPVVYVGTEPVYTVVTKFDFTDVAEVRFVIKPPGGSPLPARAVPGGDYGIGDDSDEVNCQLLAADTIDGGEGVYSLQVFTRYAGGTVPLVSHPVKFDARLPKETIANVWGA